MKFEVLTAFNDDVDVVLGFSGLFFFCKSVPTFWRNRYGAPSQKKIIMWRMASPWVGQRSFSFATRGNGNTLWARTCLSPVGTEKGRFFSYFTPYPAPSLTYLSRPFLPCPFSGLTPFPQPSLNPKQHSTFPSVVTWALKMETAFVSETLTYTYETTSRQNQRLHHHLHCVFLSSTKLPVFHDKT